MSQNNIQNIEKQLISALEELNKKVMDGVKSEKQKYIFAENVLSVVNSSENASEEEKELEESKIKSIQLGIREILSEIRERGYNVEMCENIDIKEVTEDSGKFYIRITGRNGEYTDIDYAKYRKEGKSNVMDERLLISKHLELLVGVLSPNDMKVVYNIVDYISYVSYFKIEQQKVYKKVGWSRYDGLPIFKYDKIYVKDNQVQGQCIGNVVDALSAENYNDNDKYTWAYQLYKIMEYSPTATLIIAAGISGIFRQMITFTKETNINMNIVGSRATGKSTIGHFVLSFFGNPDFLEGSFTDTENAMEVIRAERTVLPYVLDERMLRIEGEAEKTKRRTLIMEIFREYEGKVKERLGKQYEDISGKRTCSPVISSSVDSMLGLVFDYGDIGQFRRFIEIELESEKVLFESGTQAELTEHIAYSCYGYGIEILMQYIFDNNLEDGEKIEVLFNGYNDKIKAMLQEVEKTNDDMNGLQSSSKRFALIVVSYAILYNALKYYLDQTVGIKYEWDKSSKMGNKLDITDRTKDITDLLIQNIIDKMKKVKQDVNIKKNILAFYDRFKHLFYLEGNSKAWDESAYVGRYTEDRKRGTQTIYVRKNTNLGWLMIFKWEYDEDKLKEYIASHSKMSNKEQLAYIAELVGGLPECDIETYNNRYGHGVTFEGQKGPARRFKDRWDTFTMKIKEHDAEGKSDSEEKEEND